MNEFLMKGTGTCAMSVAFFEVVLVDEWAIELKTFGQIQTLFLWKFSVNQQGKADFGFQIAGLIHWVQLVP